MRKICLVQLEYLRSECSLVPEESSIRGCLTAGGFGAEMGKASFVSVVIGVRRQNYWKFSSLISLNISLLSSYL